MVKYAIGGTTLTTDWKPDGTGYCYTAFKAAVKAAMQNLTRANLSPSIAGMIWMQGEGEAHTGVGSPICGQINPLHYYRAERFRHAGHALRDWPHLDLLWTKANNQRVRTAEETVPGQMRHVSADQHGRTGQWPLGTDYPGHYNAQGQIQLGIRFANAIGCPANKGSEKSQIPAVRGKSGG